MNRSPVSLAESAIDTSRLWPPIDLYQGFLDGEATGALQERSRIAGWQRGTISLYGREISVPREEVVFGDDGLEYKYRGATIVGEAWPDFLLELRHQIESLTGFRFHFAVGNRYADGRDSIGWHADTFPQIGPRPPIASLSLGATRRFKLRHKTTRETIDLDLTSGTLLIMRPGCQKEWEHCLPKTARPVGERINWTFRPHIGGLAQRPPSQPIDEWSTTFDDVQQSSSTNVGAQ